MSAELEARIWCPRCREDKYEVRRVPSANENVFQHVTEPKERSGMKTCECGTNLERKP